MTNTDSYTVARVLAAGAGWFVVCAALTLHYYRWQVALVWLLVAALAAFGAWYDQRVVRRSKKRRRAYTRSQDGPTMLVDVSWINDDTMPRVWTPDSVIADLLIQEDHRRIREAEKA